MSQNLISATLTAEDAAEVQQLLAAIRAKLPVFEGNITAQSVPFLKLGNAYLPFIDEAMRATQSHPEILAPIFDKEEFARDWEFYKALRPIADQIGELLLCVEKSMAAAGGDALSASLEVYTEVKQNKSKIPGIQIIADNMSAFFKKTRKKKTDEK